jgi:hypothetical protein
MGTAECALLISVLSFPVTGSSLWVAISAKRQAGKVATLAQRTDAINHMQQNEQYDQDKDALKRCLDDVLDLMKHSRPTR